MERGFRLLEHPSDMGIEAFGPGLADAFEEAARGLISIVVDPSSVAPAVPKHVSLSAGDVEGLLVRWLSEVLYQYDGEHFLSTEFHVTAITEERLDALLVGEQVLPSKHLLRTDIKAITYHQLTVEQEPGRCTVRCFLDV